MKTDFFSTCKTQADAKAQYQRLASRYHPDKNPAKDKAEMTAIMQEINRQYQQFKPRPEIVAEEPIISVSDLQKETRNWYLIETFIRNELIHTCQTHLVDELFAKQVFEWDEIDQPEATAEICDANGQPVDLTESDIEEYREEVETALSELYDLESDLLGADNAEKPTLSPTITHPLFVKPTPLSCAINTLERVLADLECAEPEQREIFEWWLITPYFARKLSKYGHPVLNNEFGKWWGRTCTGQSLSCDDFIWELAHEAGLFDKEQAA
jgi:hypothetical protein